MPEQVHGRRPYASDPTGGAGNRGGDGRGGPVRAPQAVGRRPGLARRYGAGVTVGERIADVFGRAGVAASLHVVDVDDDPERAGGDDDPERAGGPVREVAVRADEQVVIASVFKILLVLEFARQASVGQLDPTERVLVRAADRLGGWGVAGCADDAEVSLRDLAYFAMSVSDNTAADLLLRRVGRDVLPMLAAELGLPRTRIVGGPRELVETMLADVGARTEAEFARIFPTLSDERVRAMRVLDPAHTTSSTAREMTRLLGLIWRDEAGPAPACATVRELMDRQLFWTRLASGFPPGVRVRAKTGTLPGLHLEAGVAEYPDGRRYAMAVFARTERLATRRIDVDLAMGEAARIAVEALRDG
ncbi:serine hydrolase [Micromonospora sp. NPDC001898]|uniref:serine hydrolase n=1 Tax=Micromonospora sp. NPDC001898 TaxID=3364221 RepID=UPI0036BBA0E5